MAVQDNIKLRKQNFTVKDGYYFTFDDDQDALLQKTDDGNTAFSYPCDSVLSIEVKSLEFDGIYFWSLSGNSIKQWRIDNYVCKLQNTYTYSSGGGHTYDFDCFSIEHYETFISNQTFLNILFHK